jgi:hypothetical protein
MKKSVIEDVEETTLEESQTSEEQTTDETVLEAEETSGEDEKTNSEDEIDEAVARANAEVKSKKSKGHVQVLANRAKEARERASQLEEANRQLMEQLNGGYRQPMSQDQPQGQYQPYQSQFDANTLTIQMLAEKQRLFEEKQAFEKAEREFPELQPGNPNYNRDFDDAVYAMVKSQNMNPVDAAKRVGNLINLGRSKASASISQAEASKIRGSVGGQSRTMQIDEADEERTSARERAKETGNVSDVANFLRTLG